MSLSSMESTAQLTVKSSERWSCDIFDKYILLRDRKLTRNFHQYWIESDHGLLKPQPSPYLMASVVRLETKMYWTSISPTFLLPKANLPEPICAEYHCPATICMKWLRVPKNAFAINLLEAHSNHKRAISSFQASHWPSLIKFTTAP